MVLNFQLQGCHNSDPGSADHVVAQIPAAVAVDVKQGSREWQEVKKRG